MGQGNPCFLEYIEGNTPHALLGGKKRQAHVVPLHGHTRKKLPGKTTQHGGAARPQQGQKGVVIALAMAKAPACLVGGHAGHQAEVNRLRQNGRGPFLRLRNAERPRHKAVKACYGGHVHKVAMVERI